MDTHLLRPSFDLPLQLTPADVAARLRDALDHPDARVDVRWARGDRHALVTPVPAERRWYTPWLHVDIRTPPAEPGAPPATLFARFSPNPALWTAYMLSLIALLAIALFALALALAQTTLDRPAWGWWVLAAAVGVALALIAGARLAQRLAAEQMRRLTTLVHAALAHATPESRPITPAP